MLNKNYKTIIDISNKQSDKITNPISTKSQQSKCYSPMTIQR